MDDMSEIYEKIDDMHFLLSKIREFADEGIGKCEWAHENVNDVDVADFIDGMREKDRALRVLVDCFELDINGLEYMSKSTRKSFNQMVKSKRYGMKKSHVKRIVFNFENPDYDPNTEQFKDAFDVTYEQYYDREAKYLNGYKLYELKEGAKEYFGRTVRLTDDTHGEVVVSAGDFDKIDTFLDEYGYCFWDCYVDDCWE